MNIYRQFAILILLFVTPLSLLAHGYWLDIKGDGKINHKVKIEICYGEIDVYGNRLREAGDDLKYTGSFQLSIMDPNGAKTAILLNPSKNSWYGEFTPKTKGTYKIIGQNDSLPVVDRTLTGGKNVKPIEYLYSQYVVGITADDKESGKFLDILTARKKNLIEIKVIHNGNLMTNAKLRVFNPENWEKYLDLSQNGTAQFYPNREGLYIIRMDWIDNKNGEWKGVKYVETRHRCNYCLFVK